MTLALAYWILLLVSAVFGFWSSGWNVRTFGGSFLVFVLLVILGWKVFGAPIHG